MLERFANKEISSLHSAILDLVLKILTTAS